MTARIGLIIIVAGMLVGGCATPGIAPTSNAPEVSPAAATPPAGAHAGLRVYIDPQTGVFTAPPPETATAASVARSFNRSHEGLVEVLNTVVMGGGFKMDLQGRFRSHFVATVDSDGKVNVRCLPENELPKP